MRLACLFLLLVTTVVSDVIVLENNKPSPTFTDEKIKLFLATPMYGGQNHALYLASVLELQKMLTQLGIELVYNSLADESLITRARNRLVDNFLQSDCSHFLFIDADIHFQPNDVVKLIYLDKDVAGGPYPKKGINWKNIIEAIKKNDNLEAQELEKLVGHYVFNFVTETARKEHRIDEPIEVMEIGTGFMMIKRKVFEQLREAYPDQRYKTDLTGDTPRYIHVFFDTIIDSKDSITGGGSDRYLSEDYMFCQLWRKIGGKIYLCPWMQTQHVGAYAFTGDIPALAKYIGHL